MQPDCVLNRFEGARVPQKTREGTGLLQSSHMVRVSRHCGLPLSGLNCGILSRFRSKYKYVPLVGSSMVHEHVEWGEIFSIFPDPSVNSRGEIPGQCGVQLAFWGVAPFIFRYVLLPVLDGEPRFFRGKV